MELTIPEDEKSALAILVGLAPSTRKRFLDGLRSIAPSTFVRDLARSLDQKFPLKYDELYNVLRALASLDGLRTEFLDEDEREPTRFATSLSDALKRDLPTLAPPDGDWEAFKTFLADLFSDAGPLSVTSKASEIRWENERTLCVENCRILSDMRPVFREKITDGPAAAILVHTLKLAYHSSGGGDVAELYVAMDRDDLFQLFELLERAIAKDESLRSFLKKAGLPGLED